MFSFIYLILICNFLDRHTLYTSYALFPVFNADKKWQTAPRKANVGISQSIAICEETPERSKEMCYIGRYPSINSKSCDCFSILSIESSNGDVAYCFERFWHSNDNLARDITNETWWVWLWYMLAVWWSWQWLHWSRSNWDGAHAAHGTSMKRKLFAV